MNSVIDQLDAVSIAGQNQTLAPHIPDGEAEHPVQVFEDAVSPMFVAMHNDFGIAGSAEAVAVTFQFLAQFREVVNLTVEDDPDGFLRIGHRLVAAFEIDNGKPPEPEPERPIQVEAFIVGAAVDDAPGHLDDVLAGNRRLVFEVKLPADSAHQTMLS
jgi:hypothetical protein